MIEGWKCPQCGKCLAPWVRDCSHDEVPKLKNPYMVMSNTDWVAATSKRIASDILEAGKEGRRETLHENYEPRFYIQDGRQIVGNCLLWWREQGRGYTCDLTEAWKVTKAEWAAYGCDRRTEVLWSVKDIDAVSKRHFDCQDLREIREAGRRKA